MPDRYPDYDAMIDWQEGASDPPAHAPGTLVERNISTDPLAVSEPVFLGNERKYVNDCIDRRWLTQGQYVGRLEAAFAEHLGRRFAIACNSGTSALHLAMLGIGIEPGDVVFVPALTYIATANAVTYCGGTPVFVDVDRETWCMSPADLERKIKRVTMVGESRIRAAIPVHLFNAVADVRAIESVMPPETFIIEDAAQAIGAEDEGWRAGSMGYISTFSMYGSKTITAGEGGMVVTDNEVAAEVMRLYRGQGADRSGHYEHSVVGYNYRMTDIGAAIALAQFETLDEHLERRRAVIELYYERLHGSTIRPQNTRASTTPGAWSMAVILPPGTNRDQVMLDMLEAGVETRPLFVPLHCTEAYREHAKASCPVSVQLANRGITLPTHAALTKAQVEKVVDALTEALA